METGCDKTIPHGDNDNEDAPIRNPETKQPQIQQQDNTTYDQWNQQQEQMKQQIHLWDETYYKEIETANGAK